MRAEPAPDPALARSALAEAQQQLLTALVADAPPPVGFDPQRIRLQAQALLDKRARAVAAHNEELACALGDDFRSLFSEYATGRPRPVGGVCADTAAFAEHLHSLGTLPASAGNHQSGRLRRLLGAFEDARQRLSSRLGEPNPPRI